MLKVLYGFETLLPELLFDEEGWKGVHVDSLLPELRRLWRQLGEYRIYLHRFTPCEQGDEFLHPHPWPMAVRILSGAYEMRLGAGADPHAPAPIVATVVMGPGCVYEMTLPEGQHAVRPLGAEPIYSFMVAGPAVWAQNRIPPPVPPREPVAEDRAEMFAFFRRAYSH